jgi:hypothetical protein
MDINNLKGLMEAYQQVNAPQEVDEGKVELDQERRSRMGRQIGKKVRSAEAEYSLSKDTMYPKGLRGAMEKGARKKVGQAQKIMGALKSAQKEEFDIFDMVFKFLQAEGFAETLEEAKWIMANELDEEAIAIIAEAMHGEKDDEDDEDEEEMKKGKKSKKSEEDDEDEEDDEEELEEASYSAKAARAGKDIGKPGKAFAKIAKSAAKRYGSKERGEKVAGAVLAKLRVKRG